MKHLYKYYRWRAAKAKNADKQAKFRLKAYRHRRTPSFAGLDLTFDPDPLATKENLTKEPEDMPLAGAAKVGFRNEHHPGRWANGPVKSRKDENGRFVDDTDWRETPQWWAEVPAANEQHMPTKLTKRSHIVSWKFNPETGRRTYYTYNYKTGKKEEL